MNKDYKPSSDDLCLMIMAVAHGLGQKFIKEKWSVNDVKVAAKKISELNKYLTEKWP